MVSGQTGVLPGDRAARRQKIQISLGLFVLAFAIRAAAAVFLPISGDHDEAEHLEPAVAIASGGGYAMVPQQSPTELPKPTAYRTPGTALLLALAVGLFGATESVARGLAVLASSTSAPLLYLFARAGVSHRAAVIAGAACALYPSWVYNSYVILSEPYFVPALLLALTLSVRAIRRGTFRSSLGAGVAWGVAVLIKPLGLPIAGLFVLYLGVRGWLRSRQAVAPAVAGALFGVSLVMAPWAIRNAVTMHRFIPLATEGGETLLGANNPYVVAAPELSGMWISPMKIPEYRERLRGVEGEVERNEAQSRIARDYLKSHPGVVPGLVLAKLRRFLSPVTGSRGLIRAVVLGTYGLLLALLALGLAARQLHHSAALHLALLWLLTMLITTAVYWGNLTRGRMPLELVFLPWGAQVAVWLYDKRPSWGRGGQAQPVQS